MTGGAAWSRWGVLSIVSLFAVGGPSPASADGIFQPQFKPTLRAERASGAIDVDGDLTDVGWQGAARATGFAEVQPGDQLAPPVESEAWITFDDQNLYVALLAFDDPSAIRVSMRERDEIFSDDYFGIMLDPYGDLASGYELFVNPLGIQGDLRLTQGGENEDGAFDAVWSSKGRITDRGYQVEIAIPFASLRFPDSAEQRWRINFWRDHQRDVRRRYAWAAINRDDPCWMCNWGTLTGISAIKPGSAFDAIANAIGKQSGTLRDTNAPDHGFENEDPDGEASLNLRYALSSNSTAELAINPDFSQIESDATQIDINQPFALFYSERRPFFQEGADLYGTWIDAVYTRSILNPELAGKFTARYGRLGVAYTLARDEDSPYIVPLREFTEGATVGKSTSQIARVRRTFGENSFLGALVTDRRIEDGGSGTIGSVDGALQFWKNLRFESQVALSRSVEPELPEAIPGGEDFRFDRDRHTVALDGETLDGHAVYASLERSARRWNSDFDFWEYSPGFRTENGFTVQNDWRQANWWNGVNFDPNHDWVKGWSPRFGFGRKWFYDGTLLQEWIRPHGQLELKYQTDLFFEHQRSNERWNGKVYEGIHATTVDWDTRFNERVAGGGGVSFGREIWRSFGDDATLGKSLNVSLNANLKPTSRFVVSPSYSYARLRRHDDGSTLYDGYILRTRLNYQFSRELSCRCVVEYNEFGDGLSLEPLATYRWNAFTVFYVGYSGAYQKYGPGTPYPEAVDAEGAEWRRQAAQVFAKFQYLLRI